MNGPEKESKPQQAETNIRAASEAKQHCFKSDRLMSVVRKWKMITAEILLSSCSLIFFFFFLGGGFYIGMYKERQTAFGAHSSTERQGKKEKGLAIKLTGDQELHNAKRSFFFFRYATNNASFTPSRKRREGSQMCGTIG